jgi:hypothetical protein
MIEAIKTGACAAFMSFDPRGQPMTIQVNQ